MQPVFIADLTTEIQYRTSRSGGKGGQNVNKVETAVAAFWNPGQSQLLDESQKARLQEKLGNKTGKDGMLMVRATDSRSQLENKAIATARLQEMVARALVIPKRRKVSRPSKAAVVARLESKAKESARKSARRKDWQGA